MDEEIRPPDLIKNERMIDDDYHFFNDDDEQEQLYIQEKQLQKAISLSLREFEINEEKKKQNEIERQKIEIERQQIELEKKKEKEKRYILTQQFLKKGCILRLSNDQNSVDAINYLQNELEKYNELLIDKIYLFENHKIIIDKFLDDMYTLHITNNKNPRISKEVYDFIKECYSIF